MICEDLNSAIASFLAKYEKGQVCFLIDENVRLLTGHYAGNLEGNTLYLTINEENKSLHVIQTIWDFLFARGMTRRGLLVCIGGGVLTDVGGFAAATYKRGIDYINIPTTLLAMIDASSGGKTGINYHGLKNSIGCFAPPVATLISPQWLTTLPAREFLSGFGEMLKTGLIAMHNAQCTMHNLWEQLLEYDLEVMDIEALTPLIRQCVAVKEGIVAADPKETGERKVLNFGHTFGHALEEIESRGERREARDGMPHGYAVVYGLIAELYLSVTKLGCPRAPLQQLTQVMLHYYGRPQCKCFDRERLIALMEQDKKNERAAEINCTLIREVGVPVINQVISPAEANEALEYLFSL